MLWASTETPLAVATDVQLSRFPGAQMAGKIALFWQVPN